MREIKFRAWNAQIKKMCKVLMIWPGDIDYGVQCLLPDGNLLLTTTASTQGIQIMQFTGLKDKNGMEIYKGDIIDNGTGNYIGAIEFKNGSFLHRNSPLGFFVEDGVIEDNRDDPDGKITLQESDPSLWAVIIGNIYEHPELLKP